MRKQVKFTNNNPLCKECWGEFVKSQCKGEVDDFGSCADYAEDCIECLEDFCEEGAEEKRCLRLKKDSKKP